MSFEIKIGYDDKDKSFVIECPSYMADMVRKLPNRRFRKTPFPHWRAPAIRVNAKHIADYMLVKPAVKVTDKAASVIEEKRNPPDHNIVRKKFPIGFKFKLPPMPKQQECLDRLWSVPTCAVYAEMGVGKTKMAIDWCSAHFLEDHINAAVISSPVSIRKNWVREFEKHCAIPYEIVIVDLSSAKKKKDVQEIADRQYDKDNKKMKVFVIGVESSKMKEKKGQYYEVPEMICLAHNAALIQDEAHNIKGHRANQAKNMVHLSKLCNYKMIMTGTPIAQGPLDLYMQFEFLNPEIIGVGDYWSFKNQYAIMGGYKNKQIISYTNIDELTEIIKPFVFQTTKEEALPDLPLKAYTQRYVKMAPEQQKMYNEMKRTGYTEMAGETNLAVQTDNALTVYLRLSQIAGGFIQYDELTDPDDEDSKVIKRVERLIDVDKNPKMKELLATIEGLPEGAPALIWCRFIPEIRMVVEILESKYGKGCCSEYHGSGATRDKDVRDEEEEKFHRGETRFFVSNPQTGGSGLTLNEAHYTIYMSNSFKLIDRQQSEDRNHRKGSVGYQVEGEEKNKVLYVDILAENTVDEKIVKALELKMGISAYVKSQLAENPSTIFD